MLIVVGTLAMIWLLVSAVVLFAEKGVQGSNIISYTDSLWWGIVTLLTVGYGDRYPVTEIGRVAASVLMLAGVTSVAILTSKISSVFLQQILREEKNMLKIDRLNGHFIVCGCKDDMLQLLLHVLDFNPEIDASRLVIVANIPDEEVKTLRAHDRLSQLQVLKGNYYHSSVLELVMPAKARKVLILADKSRDEHGNMASTSEVDARTIMTAMTLNSIARGTLVAAEILDSKMDQYLKIANVNEIIYTREYHRLILGNASGGTGVANILFDLMDPSTPTVLTTRLIDDSVLPLSYGLFKTGYELRHPKSVVIGVLENIGNSNTIKERALKQAQREPNIEKMVSNLRSVKEIRCNFPVFNPDSNYKIPEGAMAIVVETRGTG